MTDNGVIALTGTSGALGGRIARYLSQERVHTLLVGRNLSRIPDLSGTEKRGPAAYDEFDAMRNAVHGASTLLLISGRLSGRRFEEHVIAFDAAIAAGVERIVYVSLMGAGEHATYSNARDHWHTEQYLAQSGVRYTILRAGVWASWLPFQVNQTGQTDGWVIKGPGGDGRVSAVSHDDVAGVAVAVLLADSDEHDGKIYNVTGPEALSLGEVASILSEVTGKPHRYETETLEEAIASRETVDEMPIRKEGWVTWFRALAEGDWAEVTDVVPRLTGRRAETVLEVLSRSKPD